MSTAQLYLRWFLTGMASVWGITRTLPPAHPEVSVVESIGGDFRAVGDDFRNVMKKHPPRIEAAPPAAGEKQLELAGIS